MYYYVCTVHVIYSERSEVSYRDSAEILWLQGICCEFEKSRSSTLHAVTLALSLAATLSIVVPAD